MLSARQVAIVRCCGAEMKSNTSIITLSFAIVVTFKLHVEHTSVTSSSSSLERWLKSKQINLHFGCVFVVTGEFNTIAVDRLELRTGNEIMNIISW